MVPEPTSGPPATTTRLGSPPVCESMIETRGTAPAFISQRVARTGTAGRVAIARPDDAEDRLALGAFQRQVFGHAHQRRDPAGDDGSISRTKVNFSL